MSKQEVMKDPVIEFRKTPQGTLYIEVREDVVPPLFAAGRIIRTPGRRPGYHIFHGPLRELSPKALGRLAEDVLERAAALR